MYTRPRFIAWLLLLIPQRDRGVLMRRYLFLLLASISWAATPKVAIRSNEVWLVKDGEAQQLTSDGKSKLQAVLSPSNNQIAYYEQCPQSENCTPSIIVLDLDGRRLKTFQPMTQAVPPAGPCGSILDIFWLTETSIGAVCHGNPSLSESLETNLASGKTVRDLLGLGFTPSPDRKFVAYVGPIVHFAAPIDQSYYLYIDKTVVYPLPRGVRPTEKEPNVVRRRGSTWIGIHEFVSQFVWSPDSERIAFVDCLSDWIEQGVGVDGATPIGDITNRRCFVAVVARTGQPSLFPISGTSAVDANTVSFAWDGPNRLSARIAGTSRKFSIP
jgi:hypothetical protein